LTKKVRDSTFFFFHFCHSTKKAEVVGASEATKRATPRGQRGCEASDAKKQKIKKNKKISCKEALSFFCGLNLCVRFCNLLQTSSLLLGLVSRH